MKTLKDLKKELSMRGLDGYFSAMSGYAKNAVRISLEEKDDAAIPVGASKLGGCPDLPAGRLWCYNEETGAPMSFICQLNLSEIKDFDLDRKLPANGMLYFFYDYSDGGTKWGFDPADVYGRKVIFYDGFMEDLRRVNPPDLLERYGVLFGSAALSFDAGPELPSIESPWGEGVSLPEEEEERFGRMVDETLEEQRNKILGCPDCIQGSMEIECAIVSGGVYCGGPEGYRLGKEAGLDRDARSWTLLLQIDSNEELGMMWGDCGRLYFFIREEDLAAGDFDKVWLILQCY